MQQSELLLTHLHQVTDLEQDVTDLKRQKTQDALRIRDLERQRNPFSRRPQWNLSHLNLSDVHSVLISVFNASMTQIDSN